MSNAISSVNNLSDLELTDLFERQEKLLGNKSFISKLPDKGEKIKKLRDKLVEEIDRRDEIKSAATQLSRLNIVSEGKDAINKMEWTGKYDEASSFVKIELDSDDEEDPLKILAQPTGAGVHKKKIVKIVPDVSLITNDDLKEIESFHNKDSTAIEHVNYIVDKCEKKDDSLESRKEPFKPYKSTVSNVHDPMKERIRKKHKHWEITAATPPLIVHGAVKLLSIKESLALQTAQTQRLQEIQTQHAMERLTESMKTYAVGALPTNPGNYRSADDSDSTNSDVEHQEVYDDDDNDRGGTVVFDVES